MIWLDGKEMVITSSEMRRADDHQTADITVRWDIADFCRTSRAQEALALEVRMADTERGGGGVR